MPRQNTMTEEQSQSIIDTLKARFERNQNRHPDVEWSIVNERLTAFSEKLWSLNEMERTGGEPDVVGRDKESGKVIFYDCSEQSPQGRRSICYDREGLDSRKDHLPKNTAVDMANQMGVAILSEHDYQALQKLGTFDSKSSSWLKTPPAIRELGGAIFGDFRYGHVFVYHNGAQSYYGGRAFRAYLKI